MRNIGQHGHLTNNTQKPLENRQKVKGQTNQERTNLILQTVQESKAWIDLKHISMICDVSAARCKPILTQLVADGRVAMKKVRTLKSPDGMAIYAKNSVAMKEQKQGEMNSEFKEAKSRFQLRTGLLQGGEQQVYLCKPNQFKELAMLYR